MSVLSWCFAVLAWAAHINKLNIFFSCSSPEPRLFSFPHGTGVAKQTNWPCWTEIYPLNSCHLSELSDQELSLRFHQGTTMGHSAAFLHSHKSDLVASAQCKTPMLKPHPLGWIWKKAPALYHSHCSKTKPGNIKTHVVGHLSKWLL